MATRHVYMAVTADRYELPICVRDSAAEMAAWCGITERAVKWYCTPSGVKKAGCRRGYKIIRVQI